MGPDGVVYAIANAGAWKPEYKTLEELMRAGVLRRATEQEAALIAADDVPPPLEEELRRLEQRMRDTPRPSLILEMYPLAPDATQRRGDRRPPWMGKKPWWQR